MRQARGNGRRLHLDRSENVGQYIANRPTRRNLKMHFREREQSVQIIRTKYDAATKKGKNDIVGRLSKNKPAISDELKAVLTPEERKDVTTWIEGYATVARLKRELAVRTLQEQLTLAEEWFADQKSNEARFLAASLVPAWTRLRAMLKKNGLVE
jgi:hypothetical protein